MVWTRLEPYLRRDIPEPTPTTTLTQFLEQLESRSGIWKDIANGYQKDRNKGTQPYELTDRTIHRTVTGMADPTIHNTNTNHVRMRPHSPSECSSTSTVSSLPRRTRIPRTKVQRNRRRPLSRKEIGELINL